MGIWTETRGLILRADGAALVISRGTTRTMPIPVALDALTANDLRSGWQDLSGSIRRVALGLSESDSSRTARNLGGSAGRIPGTMEARRVGLERGHLNLRTMKPSHSVPG